MATAKLIEIDPRELAAHPANPRGDLGDLEELAQTIADPDGVGLLQPIVVTPVDGGYRILAGHRRNAAAIQAGAATVTCVVRPDLAERSPEQLAAMLVENEHRQQLKPSESARGYEQLAAFEGWTPQRIAKVTGRSSNHVNAQLSLAKLPVRAHAIADAGALTLDDAAALQEFANDPKTLDRVLRKGDNAWGVRHVIAEEQSRRRNRQRAQELRDELVAAGVELIRRPKGWPWDCREADVKQLRDADGGTPDPDEVRALPGFAAFVETDCGARVVVVCLDPQAHGYRREGYTRYVSPQERETKAQAEREAAALREALTAAAGVRRQFIQAVYGTAKGAKKAYADALRAVVREPQALDVDREHHALVVTLAGADPDEVPDGAGVDRLARMLVARWVAHRENNLADVIAGRRWATYVDAAAAWLDDLVVAGYALSEAETTLLGDLRQQLAGEQQADERDDDTDLAEGGDTDPTDTPA